MLVLARYAGESIQIAENIRVTVTSVSGHRVRLGISAPPHIRVTRLELLTEDRPNSDESTYERTPAPANRRQRPVY
jgi:carbon storage regulator